MNNKRATKRALLTSVMALVMCVVMLVGTTFAWFTDTASTGVNKIQAGNLDVELEYKNSDTPNFTKADKNTKVFKDGALWEPGHVEYVVLKISNAGNLALKYKLGINIASETGSTNVLGNAFNLSDYIRFAVLDGDKTVVSGGTEFKRETLMDDVTDTNSKLIKAGYTSKETRLYPEVTPAVDGQASEKVVTLVVWMPKSVGNEANYDATVAKAPVINLGINVAATQATAEFDSFDDQYDKGAEYPIVAMDTLQELINNAAEPVSAKLEGNIAGSLTVPQDKNITLDLNGFTLTGGDTHAILNRGTLCIKDSSGNGKIVASKANTSALRNGDNAVCVIEGGTFSRDGANGNTWHVVENFGKMTFNGGKVVLKNGNGFAITNGWNYPISGFDPTTHAHAVMEINALDLDTDSSGIKNCKCGDLTVNDVTVKSTGYWALSNDYLGTAVINGGTLTSTSFKAVSNGAAMTVNGGTFDGTQGFFVQNYATSTVLNGGTFANMNVDALSGYVGTGHTAQQSGTSVIIK
ncbi:MAG: hypothetical protein EGQ43_07595 [Clostridiales bacterium]|nr:hypothetical protein [Clostridiales bacterium]